jgi:hypothetical protein
MKDGRDQLGKHDLEVDNCGNKNHNYTFIS